ncbi:MAG: hypothetical protein R2806_09725 [Saprospiraceae bacterium]
MGFNAPKLNLYWGGLDSIWVDLPISGSWFGFIPDRSQSPRGPLQWGLIGSMVFILLISLGKNAGFFNQMLYNTLPLFNSSERLVGPYPWRHSSPVWAALWALQALLFIKKKTNDRLVILKRSGITMAAIIGIIILSGLVFFDLRVASTVNLNRLVSWTR